MKTKSNGCSMLYFALIFVLHSNCTSDKTVETKETPLGVPADSIWRYVEFISEPPGARIEVNGNYIGITPCTAPIWKKGQGQAILYVGGYSSDATAAPQQKTLLVPPIPERIYFDFRVTAIEQRQSPNTYDRMKQTVPASRTQAYAGFIGEHFIDEVLGDGSLIRLDDGSLWEPDEVDRVYTSLWLTASNVILIQRQYRGNYFYEMVNTDDDPGIRIYVRFVGSR